MWKQGKFKHQKLLEIREIAKKLPSNLWKALSIITSCKIKYQEKVNVESIGKQKPLKSLYERNLKFTNSVNKYKWKK